MRELHETTCEFIISFYHHAQRYINITASLLSQGILDHEQAVCRVRGELYKLHDQILKLVSPLERRITRFRHQIQIADQVGEGLSFLGIYFGFLGS